MSSILSKLINLAGNITGILSVANGGTGLASGTDGGILGYTATGTLASSGALTANQLIKGGGAGVTPSTLAAGTNGDVLEMVAGVPAYSSTITTLKTFNAGIVVSSAANQATLNNFQRATTASTFTFNNTGGTSSSATLVYYRIDDWVTLFLPAINATSGTASTLFTSDTAIEAWARPTGTATGPIANIRNNAAVVAEMGFYQVNSAGNIVIRRTTTSTAWSNAVSCGIQSAQSLVYYVGSGS